MGIPVELSWFELRLAAEVGITRNIEAIAAGKPTRVWRQGGPSASWGVHVDGAAAEMAACKALGIYWSGSINTYQNEADVLKNIEIRSRAKADAPLIIRPKDDDDKIFVHLTGTAVMNDFVVHGWIRASDAKVEKYWEDTYPAPSCWFVPAEDLWEIEKLRSAVQWR